MIAMSAAQSSCLSSRDSSGEALDLRNTQSSCIPSRGSGGPR